VPVAAARVLALAPAQIVERARTEVLRMGIALLLIVTAMQKESEPVALVMGTLAATVKVGSGSRSHFRNRSPLQSTSTDNTVVAAMKSLPGKDLSGPIFHHCKCAPEP